MGNKGISDKARLLLEYSENLFLNYEGKLNYQTSETLMKEFWDKILEFAKSKGCDMDLFYLDGEFIGFDTEDDYKKYKKSTWGEYAGDRFFYADWL